jgi:chromosome segregation ATPase
MHLDFLKAKREQAQAQYDQLRRDLDTARQTVQRTEVQAINQEGYLRALDDLIREEQPAIPLGDALAELGVTAVEEAR